MRSQTSAAFTLIEVLLVVVCLSIIALLVIPAEGDVRMTRLRAGAQLLIADLEFAQLQSIGDGANPCVVVFDPVKNQYHIATQSDPQTPILDASTGQPYITQFGSGRASSLTGVVIEELTVGDDDQLGFTAIGSLDQPEPAGITLRSGSHILQIMLDPSTGEPAVE